MDRNISPHFINSMIHVALRKESVDRNRLLDVSIKQFVRSLSARRAWIEMHKVGEFQGVHFVALRKESVDRNCQFL